MDYQEIVDNLPISTLKNTDEDAFWFVKAGTNKFARRYCHEEGEEGDVFFDGNNGDCWLVLAINTGLCRAVVRNMTQGGDRLVIWGDL
jgi:hypothetical protein